MKVLGIETSCDETAVSIVEESDILSSKVASQHEIHSKFGGIVPELASRRHAEVIYILIKDALLESKTEIEDIDGVAVTKAPGLIGALLVGLSAAKAIAYSLGRPLIGVNHLEGHINAIHLSNRNINYPHIGLIVSGGHTSLYLVKEFGDYQLLGATRDDAAGEAFDKVARLLDLGYPGGPIIDKLAKKGNPSTKKFTQPKFRDESEFDFSFSGIKTAVRISHNEIRNKKGVNHNEILDLVASFQKGVVDILIYNTIRAAKKFSCSSVVVAGGVAANSSLRENLTSKCAENNLSVFIPPINLCTDNAAMIAYVGCRYIKAGHSDDMSINASAVEEIGC